MKTLSQLIEGLSSRVIGDVAIPITDVTGADDGIQLGLTKDQVRDLPPVGIDHPTW